MWTSCNLHPLGKPNDTDYVNKPQYKIQVSSHSNENDLTIKSISIINYFCILINSSEIFWIAYIYIYYYFCYIILLQMWMIILFYNI